MTCLAASLVVQDSDHVLWLSPTAAAEPVHVAQLRSALAQIRLDDFRGKRVGIGTMPVLELLATLVLLDGLADAILMLPNEEDETARANRLAQAQIDHGRNGKAAFGGETHDELLRSNWLTNGLKYSNKPSDLLG